MYNFFLCCLLEEVSALLKALVLYHFEEKASNLQNLFNELLQLIETKIKEIWNNESTSNDAVCTYGPEATVQSILAQRQNVLAMEKGKTCARVFTFRLF